MHLPRKEQHWSHNSKIGRTNIHGQHLTWITTIEQELHSLDKIYNNILMKFYYLNYYHIFNILLFYNFDLIDFIQVLILTEYFQTKTLYFWFAGFLDSKSQSYHCEDENYKLILCLNFINC